MNPGSLILKSKLFLRSPPGLQGRPLSDIQALSKKWLTHSFLPPSSPPVQTHLGSLVLGVGGDHKELWA